MEGYERRYSFFEGYYRAMAHMTDAQELEFRRAIDSYAFEGEVPEFQDPMLLMAWDLVICSLDKSIKLSNAGRKGGRGNKKHAEKGAIKGAFKPGEQGFEATYEAFKHPFNEEEEEGEVEEEKEEDARHAKLLSFYSQVKEG